MRATRSWRYARPRGSRLVSLVTAAGLAALAGAGLTGPGLVARAASLSAGPPSVRAAAAVRAASQAAAPPVPASASFVAAPQVAGSMPGVRQACSTPSQPGEMACMALIVSTVRGGGDRADVSPPAGSSYDPSQLQDAYGLASAASKPADGETIAIVDAYNDPSASADLAAYRSAYGLPACDQSSKCLTIENEHGGTTDLPSKDTSGGWELEESLDLEMVSAICPNCSIRLIEANSASISALATAERTATRSGAEAVSNSWGSGAEFTGESAYDPDFYAPGVAITAAGGDDGYGTQYPAVSPYVTSVGGTTLTDSGGHWSQSAWSGTGAGCSELEPKPSWQTSDATSPGGCLNRTDNDVAADANPDPGVWIYDTVRDPGSGAAPGWIAVGGTSVSTPIVAAAYALADVEAGGPHQALIPETFPAAYPYQNSSDFLDVTSGSDGSCEPARRYLCHAGAGYDGPTGVGTIDGTAGLTGPRSGEVTVLGPGTQVYQSGAKIRLQLDVQPGQDTPTMTVAGLAGLAVGTDQVLTGTAPAATGVHRVTVTATLDGQSDSSSFDVVIVPKVRARHPAAGEIRLNGGSWCLTGSGYRVTAGTPAVLERCSDRAAQKWKLEPAGGVAGTGIVTIDGLCLAVRSGSGNGAKASIQGCGKNATRQQWTYQGRGRLRNAATGKCLAVHGSAGAGRQAVILTCSNAAPRRWVLPAAPVVSAVAGRCLSDPGSSRSSGTRIAIAVCRQAASQRWTAEPNGTLKIAGKCLAVKGSSMLDGAAIELAKCSAAGSQRWARGPHGELMNARSGRCLADPGNSRKSGTGLTQEDCYSVPGEIWVVS